jgi:flagellar hook assembly protein FlgD
MKIIFTELQQQDPLKPNDSNALLQQLNSIRSIESDVAMGDKLQSIVFQNQLASAGNLIGKNITGLNDQSQRVSGTVKSVTREGQKVSLILNNNWKVPIDNLENINATQPNTGG